MNKTKKPITITDVKIVDEKLIKEMIDEKITSLDKKIIEELVKKYDLNTAGKELVEESIKLINEKHKQALKGFCDELKKEVKEMEIGLSNRVEYEINQTIDEAKLKHFGEDLI
jgi:polyhydroxyalkanoate synthesis regulator phasin